MRPTGVAEQAELDGRGRPDANELSARVAIPHEHTVGEHGVHVGVQVQAPAEALRERDATSADSPFHVEFGYYADPVEEGTATLPAGWRRRLVNLPPGVPVVFAGLASTPTTSQFRST